MTGAEFEIALCKAFKSKGFWALNIPRNKFGAQPFDVIAIKRREIWAVDCKVCSTSRLPISRIEDNQWLAFEQMKKLTEANCGFICLYKNELYFIPIELATAAQNMNFASIKLAEKLKLKGIEIQ